METAGAARNAAPGPAQGTITARNLAGGGFGVPGEARGERAASAVQDLRKLRGGVTDRLPGNRRTPLPPVLRQNTARAAAVFADRLPRVSEDRPYRTCAPSLIGTRRAMNPRLQR